MKKKYLLIGLALVLLISVSLGATYASLNTNTENKIGAGIFEISTCGIGISLSGQGLILNATEKESISPGATYENPLYVVNDVTGDGYDIYAKVIIYKAWEEDGLDPEKIVLLYGNEGSYTEYSDELLDGDGPVYVGENNDWLLFYADDEEIILYYTKPLEKGESSSCFLNAIYLSSDMDNSYQSGNLDLEVEVKAVQRNTEEEAMQAEWGVFPLFDSDGNIINVYETKSERDSAEK